MKYHIDTEDYVNNMRVRADFEADVFDFILALIIVLAITLVRIISMYFGLENQRTQLRMQALMRPVRARGGKGGQGHQGPPLVIGAQVVEGYYPRA